MTAYFAQLVGFENPIVIYASTNHNDVWPSTSWWMIPVGPAIINPYEE